MNDQVDAALKPRIFFSYSETKSHNQALVAKVINIAKAVVAKRGWGCQDPMEEGGFESIADKVEGALLAADGLIAECSTTSPNVMFEIGYARALGYPTILLVNRSLHEAKDATLREYLKFLGMSPGKTLPADLGDIECIFYGDDFSEVHRANYESTLEKVLAAAELHLASGHLRLSRGRKKLRNSVVALRNAHAAHKDPPLLRFLGGWMDKVAEDLGRGEKSEFDVDSDYYEPCFRDFGDLRASGRAVADLTDPIEAFWLRTDAPKHLPVQERIFVVSPLDLLNRDQLFRVTNALKEHKASEHPEYRVLIAPLDHAAPAGERLFGSDTCGHHMLMFEPNMTAGYVRRNGRTLLRVTSDPRQHKQATALYRGIRERAIDFVANPLALRRKWLDRDQIGRWNVEWGKTTGPTPDYFLKYDCHIRCWIPDYETLIDGGAQQIIAELRLNRPGTTGEASRKILEIGCGTGALTNALVHHGKLAGGVFDLFLATDRELRMIELARQRLDGAADNVRFERFTAFSAPGVTAAQRKFDLICGSLVLHDIIKDAPSEEALVRVLKQCAGMLTANGSMMFIDSFVRTDGSRDQHRGYWNKWMTDFGLTDEDVRAFLDNNQDMLRTATEEMLVKAARASGFATPRFTGIPGLHEHSPFQLLQLNRA